jgi:hypothetical protein
MTMKLTLFLITVCILSGCATASRPTYDLVMADGKSESDFVIDYHQCGYGVIDDDYYFACMQKKGYTVKIK